MSTCRLKSVLIGKDALDNIKMYLSSTEVSEIAERGV